MTNTMLLAGFDPQSTAAPSGVQPGRPAQNGQRTDKSSGKSLDESFKKKLQELGGYAGAVAPNGGSVQNVNQETGMQGDADGMEAAAPGTIEGLEQPVQTQLTAQMLALAGEPLAPAGEEAVAFAPELGAETAETGDFARMQAANAGEAPVLTQDQILEAVGAYLGDAGANGPAQEAPAALADAPVPTTEPKAEPAPADAQPEGVEPQQAEPKEQFAPVQPEPAAQPAENLERAEPAKVEAAKQAAPKPAQEANALPEQNPAVVQEAPRAAQEAPSAIQAESAPAQAFEKENVLRIVESIETNSAEGKHEFEIGLKPEFLGKIRIKLSMEHGNIHMLIKTDDPQVKQMMNDHASSLMNELREKGISLSSMDVAFDNSQPDFDGGQQFHQSGGRRGAAARANFFAQTEPAADAAKDVAGLTAGKSTVEFFA